MNKMSYPYHHAPHDEFFFRIPHDKIPLVVHGRAIDSDLEARVEKALRADFEANSSWRPKPTVVAVAESRWWRKLLDSLRTYVGILFSHAAAFSLGSYLAGARH